MSLSTLPRAFDDLAAQLWSSIRQAFLDLLAVDQKGPRRRFWLALLGVGMFWFLMILLEGVPQSRFLRVFPIEVTRTLPFPWNYAFELMYLVTRVIFAFFTQPVLRHLFPLALGLGLAVEIGSRYLDDLFELDDPSATTDYLLSATFGLFRMGMEIRDGQVVEAHRDRPIAKIGGPGVIRVNLGNAIGTEQVGGRARVYGPVNGQFVEGFERLREVIDLHDQIATQDQVKALTRDGIPVTARDIKVVFRVRAYTERTPYNPFPFNEQAVRRLVYSRAVGKDGPRPWMASLPSMAAGIVADFIARNTLDNLIQTQRGGNPREDLTAIFYSPEVETRLATMGLELVWVGVGTWETPEAVSQQRIQAWQQAWLAAMLADPANMDQLERSANVEAKVEIIDTIEKWWVEHHPDGPNPTTAPYAALVFHNVLQSIRSDPEMARPLGPKFDDVLQHLRHLGPTVTIG